jgi:hypothetical protein
VVAGLSCEDAPPVPGRRRLPASRRLALPAFLTEAASCEWRTQARVWQITARRRLGIRNITSAHQNDWSAVPMLASPIRRQVGNVQALCDARMSQTPARARPTGPFCTKCSSKTKKMKLSHVTLHRRASISFERHTFVCTGCGHSRTCTTENASRSTSSNRWRNDVGNFWYGPRSSPPGA